MWKDWDYTDEQLRNMHPAAFRDLRTYILLNLGRFWDVQVKQFIQNLWHFELSLGQIKAIADGDINVA